MITHQVFTTPIYENLILDREESHKELNEVIEDLKNKNVFKPNLFTNCHMLSDPSFSTNLFEQYELPTFKSQLETNLLEYIKLICPELADVNKFFIETSWIAWNRPGDYAHIHHHGYSDISGVYYFKTNGDDGDLSLHNPNPVLSTSLLYTNWQERFHIKPKLGNLILFPGWLKHNVLKNQTEDDRISVSFNVVFKRG